MKKMKLIKVAILFLAVFAFSNCEEDGEIQFIVVDEFETNATVSGLAGLSSISINQSMNVSDLLNTGSEFVEADVESVIITLNDYDGASINGNFNIAIGSVPLINQTLSLTTGVPNAPITIPADASNILSSITSGNVQVALTGTTNSPIADNNFTLNLKFKIKAKVQ